MWNFIILIVWVLSCFVSMVFGGAVVLYGIVGKGKFPFNKKTYVVLPTKEVGR
jgi:hypothetical protein